MTQILDWFCFYFYSSIGFGCQLWKWAWIQMAHRIDRVAMNNLNLVTIFSWLSLLLLVSYIFRNLVYNGLWLECLLIPIVSRDSQLASASTSHPLRISSSFCTTVSLVPSFPIPLIIFILIPAEFGCKIEISRIEGRLVMQFYLYWILEHSPYGNHQSSSDVPICPPSILVYEYL